MPHTYKDIGDDRERRVRERDRELGWFTKGKLENIESLKARVEKAKAEYEELQRQLELMTRESKMAAIAEIRNIMRAQELTMADMLVRRRGRPRKERT